MTAPKITQHCIMCDEDGHTYLECPKVNFMSLFVASIGGEPGAAGGQSRESLAEELKEIEDRRAKELAG